MTLRVIDVETTGTNPDTDRIVEIASIDLTRDGEFYRAIERLVNPGIPIPPLASSVHHIIDADVASQPPLAAVIAEFAGADCYVAHNAAFEQSFLSAHLGGKPDWVCTMKCALRLWPDAPGFSNQALRYWLGILNPFDITRESLQAHRALSDVYVTAAIFLEMLKRAKYAQLVAWSREPKLYTRFAFGKHKGQPLSDVPDDYLRWVVEKSDLDADAKFSAKHWLAQRKSAA